MFGQAVRIAMEKTTSKSGLVALRALAAEADAYDLAELELPRLIAEHKARRSAKPVKLNKSTRASLANFAADQDELLANLREQYSSSLSPEEIISSLALALEADIPRSVSLVKFAPPEDQPLVQSRVEAKRTLLAAIRACQTALRGTSAA